MNAFTKQIKHLKPDDDFEDIHEQYHIEKYALNFEEAHRIKATPRPRGWTPTWRPISPRRRCSRYVYFDEETKNLGFKIVLGTEETMTYLDKEDFIELVKFANIHFKLGID